MTAGTRTPHFARSFRDGLKRNWQVNVLFIVLVMALAAIIAAMSGIAKTNEQNRLLNQQVACQNRYNQINNERTRLLAGAAERESKASSEVDTAFLALTEALASTGNRDEALINQLFSTLNDKLKAQKAARELTINERLKNPVPPPPEALCGNTRR